MLDEVIIRKTLRLLKAAGIDCGEFKFAGFAVIGTNWRVIQFVPMTAKRIINVYVLRSGEPLTTVARHHDNSRALLRITL